LNDAVVEDLLQSLTAGCGPSRRITAEQQNGSYQGYSGREDVAGPFLAGCYRLQTEF
jgi:hypothetical protein